MPGNHNLYVKIAEAAARGDTLDFKAVGLKADVIAESTEGAGVTLDGTLIKDGIVTALLVGNVTGNVQGNVNGNLTGQVVTPTPAAVTASESGAAITRTGLITIVNVTSASANNIVKLPAPSVGSIVILNVGANGYELVTSDAATISLGGNTATAGHESAIPANSIAVAFCLTATAWVGFTITGQTLAAIETAAT